MSLFTTPPDPRLLTNAPCVFCGAELALLLGLTRGLFLVQCAVCRAQGPVGETAEQAITAWGCRGALPWQRCPVCRRRFIPRSRRQKYDRRQCGNTAFSRRRRAQHTTTGAEPTGAAQGAQHG